MMGESYDGQCRRAGPCGRIHCSSQLERQLRFADQSPVSPEVESWLAACMHDPEHPNAERMPPALRGILWALLGTCAFSVILALGKLIGVDAKVPALQIVFLRYVGGLATMGLISRRRGKPLERPGWTALRAHLMRAIFGSAGVVCSLYAATHMPFADATAIGLTQGVLVVVLAALFLGEKVSVAQWVAGGVCGAGAFVVVLGQGGFHQPAAIHWWPMMVGLAGALLVAAEIVMIRTLAVRDSAEVVLLYVNLLGSLFLAGPALAMWQPVAMPQLLLLLMLGPLGIAAQYFNIRAFRLAGASLLGPAGYSRLLFAAVLGFLMFGEVPGSFTWIGGAVMIGGGIALARLHSKGDRSR